MFTKMHVMCNVVAARTLIPSKRLVPKMMDIAAFIISDIVRAHPHPQLKLRKASQILTRWSTLVSKKFPQNLSWQLIQTVLCPLTQL